VSLGIVPTLSGASDPQAVQLGVTGLTAGVAFTVTGTTGTWSWTVPGGNGQLAGSTSVVLADFLVPLAVPATYTVTQSGASATTSPVTVFMLAEGDAVLHSLDGQTTAPAMWTNSGDTREQTPRVATYMVPGRSSPVIRWDVASTDSGTLVIDSEGAASATLRSLVAVGAPLIFRTNGPIFDVDPVQVVVVTKAPRVMVGIQGSLRRWSISYQVIDYPDLGSLLAASTWADFDAAWSTFVGTDFDAYFAGLTGDQFDIIDWSTF
jgi:hypothetical protein